MNIQIKVRKKILTGIVGVALSAMSLTAHSYVIFVGGPVIDVSKIVTEVVNSGKEMSQTLLEQENMAMDIIQQSELFYKKYWASISNTKDKIVAKTDLKVDLANLKLLSLNKGIVEGICISKKTAINLQNGLCEAEVEGDKTKDMLQAGKKVNTHEEIDRVNSNWAAKADSDSNSKSTVIASDGTESQLSNEMKAAYKTPKILVNTDLDKNQYEYEASLDLIRLMAGLDRNYVSGSNVSIDNIQALLSSGKSNINERESIKHDRHNKFKEYAFNAVSRPVLYWGYEGKTNVLDSVKSIGTSEFGSELAKNNIKFYNKIENNQPGMAIKRKLLTESKKLYMKLVVLKEREKLIEQFAVSMKMKMG